MALSNVEFKFKKNETPNVFSNEFQCLFLSSNMREYFVKKVQYVSKLIRHFVSKDKYSTLLHLQISSVPALQTQVIIAVSSIVIPHLTNRKYFQSFIKLCYFCKIIRTARRNFCFLHTNLRCMVEHNMCRRSHILPPLHHRKRKKKKKLRKAVTYCPHPGACPHEVSEAAKNSP